MAIVISANAFRITAILLAITAAAFKQIGEIGIEEGDVQIGISATETGLVNPWMTKALESERRVDHAVKSCSMFDDDLCSCAFQGCSYDVNEKCCVPNKKDCDLNDFWPGACRRKQAFYSVGGRICQNHKKKGACEWDQNLTSNFAVNMNGFSHIDVNGIVYKGQNDTDVKPGDHFVYRNSTDCHVSICKKAGRGDAAQIKSFPEDDFNYNDVKNLLWTYVEVNSKNRNLQTGNDVKKSCISFPIKFESDGVFELSIRSTEIEYYFTKTRLFDIKMNEMVIFPNVDLVGLAGKPCIAINLMINFVVRKNMKEIHFSGFEESELKNKGRTVLEFCNSKCSAKLLPVRDSNFVINTFAITKLERGGDTKT